MTADLEVRARVGMRHFADRSWNGLVSRIAAAYQLETTAVERVAAARALEGGLTVRLGNSVSVTPVSS